MIYADYLSRIQPSPGPTNKLKHVIHMIQISGSQVEKARATSKAHPFLDSLSKIIVDGWPGEAKQCPKQIRPYWSMKDNLLFENGLVYAGQQQIIPDSFRKEYLECIHVGHLRVSISKLRAKDCIYWQHIMADIEQHVSGCFTCQSNAKIIRK
jgi:hypothetical protein